MTTPLDMTVTKAVDIYLELEGIDAARKLTADAFRRDALAIAGANMARIEEIESILAERGARAEAVASFVNRLSLFYREPGASRPFVDCAKALRVYGRDDTGPQIADMKATASEICALAAVRAVKRFPDSFGSVRDFDQHLARADELRQGLSTLYKTMRQQFSSADIRMDTRTLGQAEREKGASVLVFARWPHVVLAADRNWPAEIVEAQARKLAAERAKQTRATSPMPATLIAPKPAVKAKPAAKSKSRVPLPRRLHLTSGWRENPK